MNKNRFVPPLSERERTFIQFQTALDFFFTLYTLVTNDIILNGIRLIKNAADEHYFKLMCVCYIHSVYNVLYVCK